MADVEYLGPLDDTPQKGSGVEYLGPLNTKSTPDKIVQPRQDTISQGQPPSTWDRVMDFFGPDKEKEAAKASNALVYSEMLGIKPSTAYKYHDEITRQIQSKLANEKIITERVGYGQAYESGKASSIFGMMANQKVPEPFESVDQIERWIHGFTQMGADLPFFLAGSTLGGGPETPWGMAGGFGFTEGIRQVLVDRYSKGEVKNFGEFTDRVKSAALATIKGQATGYAMGAVGTLPYGYKAVNELATMTVVSKAVEGQFPTAKDFTDNMAIFLAMHTGISAYEQGKADIPKVKEKFYDMYAKQGIHPRDIAGEGLKRQAIIYADTEMGRRRQAAMDESDKRPDIKDPLSALKDIEAGEPIQAKPKEPDVTVQPVTGLRPAVNDEIGEEGQTHDDVIKEKTGEDGDRGFATPDGNILTRKEAEDWVKENEPEVHRAWKEDTGKGAEFHSEDYNAAKEKTTGIKNAAVDAQREEMGLDPIESPTRKMDDDNWEKAKTDVDSGKADPLLLARSIIEQPRNLSPEETNVMNYGRAKLSAEHKTAMDAIEEARDYGDTAAEKIARDKLKAIEENIDTMDTATKKAGTEWGLSGLMRQRMVKEDYSLDRLVQRARVASPSGEVSPEMRAKLEDLSKQLEEANRKIAEHEEEKSNESAQKVVDKIKNEISRQDRKATRAKTKDQLKGEYNSLMKSLDRQLSGFHANPMFDPDTIALIAKITRNRVEAGIVRIEDIVDDIHATLKGIGHDFEKRDIRDAISGYGVISEMSKDEIDVKLREARRQGRLLSALEDAKAKEVPQRSGLQRDEPSDEVRELNRQVRQAMRESGIDSSKGKSPEEQWKTSLDAVKTRLKNHIRDLAKQIETGEKTPKKVGVKYDDQAEVLKSLRDRMKATLEAIEGKSEMSPEQRVRQATASVEKSIAEYERRIKDKDLKPAQKVSKTPETPEIKALREQRDKLKETFKAMQKEANPKKSPEEIALKSYKTRIQNRIKDMEGRLASGDFSKEPKKTLELDTEAQKLKAKAEKVKEQVDTAIKKQEFEGMSKAEKGLYYFSKWRRAMLLSSVTTLGKLESAAMARFGITPIEELIGGVLSHVPGIKNIAEKAQREGGGLNISAEAKAFSQFVDKNTLEDVKSTLKTGIGSLDYLYGKKGHLPPEVLDFFGHLHAALKVLPKRAEFFRSLEIRSQWALDNHLDLQDPKVQATLCADAYIDANRAIFMDDNSLTTGYRILMNYFENKGLGGRITATAMRTFLPIVKVPTNFAKETANYAGGSAKGAVQTLQVLIKKDGLKNLTIYQADNIMRSLKKGSLGLALLAIGYYASDNIAGYYQPGKKQNSAGLKPDDVRIGGVNIPHWLLHFPPVETMRIGATLREVNNSYDIRGRAGGLMAGAYSAASGLAKTIPFFDEPGRISKALDSPDMASTFVGDLIKSLAVPPDVQKIAGMTDPQEGTRSPKGMVDAIKTGIPGLREDVPMKGRQKRYSIRGAGGY